MDLYNKETLEIFLDKNNKERIYICENEFNYDKKEDNSHYNSRVIRVTSSYISFYDKIKTSDNSYRTIQLKFDKNFSYMKLSETIKFEDNHVEKIDKYTLLKDNEPFIREVFRNYDNNKDGHLVDSYDKLIPLTDSNIEEFIKLQLVSNKEISDLYRYIENYSQDIIYLISDINPDFNYLIDNFSKDNKCFVKEKKS